MARILVADDEPNIVISLEYLLRRAGHEVVVAHDGRQALDAAARERPDLILLDVMMPLKTGFEVCQHLRATTAFLHVPIIMLTARGRDTDRAKGLALGADAYLTKPFSTRELMDKVAELLARSA